MSLLRIARAENDLLYDEEGRRYVDLFSGHGTAWLGHANRDVVRAVAEQLDRVWCVGGLETAVQAEARARVESFFPDTHRLAALYSTGMEAAEFALRVARVVTGRTGAVGFEHAMHGKSLAAAYLGWDNRDGVVLPGFVRLPFVPTRPEGEILEQLDDALTTGTASAVFVEPLQGCGGGHAATPAFYEQVARLCREHGALLVFDEILTGFHRTGPAFFFSDLGFVPDIVLIGKALGNGFPVSGVVLDRRYAIDPRMLPGSTFAGNPLAAAAVVATLSRMREMDLPAAVAAVADVITEELAGLRAHGMAPRGRGAMWVVELPPGPDVWEFLVRVYGRGVCVSCAGRLLRLLPAATIEPANLRAACAVVREELLRSYGVG